MTKKGHYTDNPCVHVDEFGKPHLQVLLHFFCEDSLPKWRVGSDKYFYDADVGDSNVGSADSKSSEMDMSEPPEHSRLHIRHNFSTYYYQRAMGETIKAFLAPEGFWKKLAGLFKSKGIEAEDVLAEAKSAVKEPCLGDTMVAARESASKLLVLLTKSGQQSQAELLKAYLNVVTAEIAMVNNGYGKYLTEDDVIGFMLKAEKGVFIDFLRNYTDMLPLAVAKKKIELDKLRIFDNYCVMFFRKDLSAFRFVEDKIIEAKLHDPILFGMVEGSDKLYYVTDWVTDNDDLTLARVEEALGRSARNVGEAPIKVDGKDVNWLISHESEIEGMIADEVINNAKKGKQE